ncbi:MAG: hypothetical protein MHMPM18_001171 [Marteilia pararefringens]
MIIFGPDLSKDLLDLEECKFNDKIKISTNSKDFILKNFTECSRDYDHESNFLGIIAFLLNSGDYSTLLEKIKSLDPQDENFKIMTQFAQLFGLDAKSLVDVKRLNVEEFNPLMASCYLEAAKYYYNCYKFEVSEKIMDYTEENMKFFSLDDLFIARIMKIQMITKDLMIMMNDKQKEIQLKKDLKKYLAKITKYMNKKLGIGIDIKILNIYIVALYILKKSTGVIEFLFNDLGSKIFRYMDENLNSSDEILLLKMNLHLIFDIEQFESTEEFSNNFGYIAKKADYSLSNSSNLHSNSSFYQISRIASADFSILSPLLNCAIFLSQIEETEYQKKYVTNIIKCKELILESSLDQMILTLILLINFANYDDSDTCGDLAKQILEVQKNKFKSLPESIRDFVQLITQIIETKNLESIRLVKKLDASRWKNQATTFLYCQLLSTNGMHEEALKKIMTIDDVSLTDMEIFQKWKAKIYIESNREHEWIESCADMCDILNHKKSSIFSVIRFTGEECLRKRKLIGSFKCYTLLFSILKEHKYAMSAKYVACMILNEKIKSETSGNVFKNLKKIGIIEFLSSLPDEECDALVKELDFLSKK